MGECTSRCKITRALSRQKRGRASGREGKDMKERISAAERFRKIKAMSAEKRRETGDRLLRAAAERYGALMEKGQRELEASRVRIVITEHARPMPWLVPGEVYDSGTGCRDWHGEPVYYVMFAGRPRKVYPEECEVL